MALHGCNGTSAVRRLLWAIGAMLSVAVSAALTFRGGSAARPSTTGEPIVVAGHRRGVVQIDLMRQIMSDNARGTPSVCPVECGDVAAPVRSQDHPLLGHVAPDFSLLDSYGHPWQLSEQLSNGPVVAVFYLGSTCTACVTHLVELDTQLERFQTAGAQIVAISDEANEITRKQFERFGELTFPVLADVTHAVAFAYSARKPGSEQTDDEALHGAFVVGKDGKVRWAWVGNQPFTDINTLLWEVERSDDSPSPFQPPDAPGASESLENNSGKRVDAPN
jgi:peroxiredoxin